MEAVWSQLSASLCALSSCCRRSTGLRDVWKTHITAWHYCSNSRHRPQKGVGFGFIKMLLTFQLMKGQIISSEKSASEGKGREWVGGQVIWWCLHPYLRMGTN